MTPTKPTKAHIAALVTVLGLVGFHVTSGTVQAVLTVAWLAVSWYSVWRTPNRPRASKGGMGRFL